MLQCYPDYAKAPPEYLASITQILAEYPANIQDRISDLRFGLPAKCKFLPTVADITEFGENLVREYREINEFSKRFKGKVIDGIAPRTLFRPFPQLWAEFGDEVMDAKVGAGVKFELLDGACKALVQHGRDAAMTMLGMASPQEGQAA